MKRYIDEVTGKFMPIAFGTLTGTLTWHPDPNDPSQEVAQCPMVVDCPYCGEQHTHGWSLTGMDDEHRAGIRDADMTELFISSHCSNGKYCKRPRKGADHAFDPAMRLVRKSRRANARRNVDG